MYIYVYVRTSGPNVYARAELTECQVFGKKGVSNCGAKSTSASKTPLAW